MKRIILSDDSALNFTPEQIASHRKEWDRGGIVEPTNPIGEIGEWELIETITQEVYYDHIDHLVGAHWDQGDPYNYYCPPKDSGSGNKPVGCSPVACGQMLQFLYSKFGTPQTFTYNGITGYMSAMYLPYVNNLEETTTPLFLRMIGNILGAVYTDTGTSVVLALNKIKTYYTGLGYSSTLQSYSANKVKQNLLNGMPVLVSGYSGTILGLPDYTNGHTYIIDGYKRNRTRYTRYYERIYGDPPCIEYKTEISYSDPHISQIKMNWGWSTQWQSVSPQNDDWYALTGDWIVSVNGGYENFTEDVSILCDILLNS